MTARPGSEKKFSGDRKRMLEIQSHSAGNLGQYDCRGSKDINTLLEGAKMAFFVK